MKKLFLVAGLLLGLCLLGCAAPKMQSLWLDREVNVDGQDQEWQSCLLHYDEKNRIMVGAHNDDLHLYVRVSSRSRSFADQAIGSGLTLWFDPDGGKDKVFGVRYPAGWIIPPQNRGRKVGGAKGAMGSVQGDFPQNPSASALPAKVEILGPEKGQKRLMDLHDAETLEDIQVRIGLKDGLFVYEGRISLQRLGGLDNNGPMGMGIQTLVRVDMGGPGRGMGAPAGGMGGPASGMGGPGSGVGPDMDEGAELWLRVWLAQKG
ncbi:MAG: hypothetical protein JEZ02_00795 [Desulfatibacillum sp.]|nr:hypothetical protein [Desulfatibacillum sp.]